MCHAVPRNMIPLEHSRCRKRYDVYFQLFLQSRCRRLRNCRWFWAFCKICRDLWIIIIYLYPVPTKAESIKMMCEMGLHVAVWNWILELLGMYPEHASLIRWNPNRRGEANDDVVQIRRRPDRWRQCFGTANCVEFNWVLPSLSEF